MTRVGALTDKAEIRRILNMDREWSLYALADLDEPLFGQCAWVGRGDALALVFHGIAIRPIFLLGAAEAAGELLAALPVEAGYLNIRTDQAEAARTVFEYRARHEMQRMFLDTFRPRHGETVPLGPEHCAEVEALYGTGDGGGIAFGAFQLENGLFRGVRRHGELVAVAGAHVVSVNEGVAGPGNIFVRPDCRGQGLAQVVTSAVVEAARGLGIRDIGLNVSVTNAPAIRAYEAIGFGKRFTYYEGPAVRVW